MYTVENFRTKKELKEAIMQGREIEVFQPNDLWGRGIIQEGKVSLEGPHYPELHKWDASGRVVNGLLVSVK